MKRLTQIFQALLGVVALILTAIVAFGRLAWRTIRNWWKKRSKWLRRTIGIMNRFTGEPVTPAIYSGINMLSNDLFEVQEYDSYDWYLLDTDGNVVLKE